MRLKSFSLALSFFCSMPLLMLPASAEPYTFGPLDSLQCDAEELGIQIQAAVKGDVNAQYNVGCAYLYGLNMAKDYNKALYWIKKSAEKDNPHAQCLLASVYIRGASDYSTASYWLERAAKQGHPVAQAELGELYLKGQGVSQNYNRAAAWIIKSAHQGLAYGQDLLGILHSEGKGVLQDYEEAAEWHEKAASQGNAILQAQLGARYLEGRGVPQNYTKAMEWMQKAVDQHDSKAFTFFKKKAELGNVDDQLIYGILQTELGDEDHGMFWLGKAAKSKQKKQSVLQWILLSCNDGNDVACKIYKRMKSQF